MRKYFGTITSSLKTKRRKRSALRKTPYEPPTTRSSQKKNSFCRCSTSHEKSTALTAVRLVTRASVRLMPSTARWYSIPSIGTQGTRTIVLKVPTSTALKNAAKLTANPPAAVASATQRDKTRGRKSSATAPANVT